MTRGTQRCTEGGRGEDYYPLRVWREGTRWKRGRKRQNIKKKQTKAKSEELYVRYINKQTRKNGNKTEKEKDRKRKRKRKIEKEKD